MKSVINFLHRRRVKSQLAKLGPALVKRYGRPKFYSAGQVTTTANTMNMPPTVLPAAFAVFLAEQDFKPACDDAGLAADYDSVREEVANICFNGDTAFAPADGLGLSAISSGSVGDIGSASDGGGGD